MDRDNAATMTKFPLARWKKRTFFLQYIRCTRCNMASRICNENTSAMHERLRIRWKADFLFDSAWSTDWRFADRSRSSKVAERLIALAKRHSVLDDFQDTHQSLPTVYANKRIAHVYFLGRSRSLLHALNKMPFFYWMNRSLRIVIAKSLRKEENRQFCIRRSLKVTQGHPSWSRYSWDSVLA